MSLFIFSFQIENLTLLLHGKLDLTPEVGSKVGQLLKKWTKAGGRFRTKNRNLGKLITKRCVNINIKFAFEGTNIICAFQWGRLVPKSRCTWAWPQICGDIGPFRHPHEAPGTLTLWPHNFVSHDYGPQRFDHTSYGSIRKARLNLLTAHLFEEYKHLQCNAIF